MLQLELEQELNFDGRLLSVTIGALESFVNKRRTTLPAFVLLFSLLTVIVVSALIGERLSSPSLCPACALETNRDGLIGLYVSASPSR